MSKWVEYQKEALKDVRPELLEEALEEIGLGINHNVKKISAYGSGAQVDFCITKDGEDLSLGIKLIEEDGKTNAEIRGDFWGTGIDQEEFSNLVSQYYQKHRIVNTLEANGIMIDKISNTKKNEIVLDISMYA